MGVWSWEEFERRGAELSRQARIDGLRQDCFEGGGMCSTTFEADASPQLPASRLAKAYVENFDEMRRQGKGLVFWGSVGTGKSFYAAAIANLLLEQEHKVRMVNMSRLVVRLQGMDFAARSQLVDELCRCELLIIDDLGAERATDFMAEQTFLLVDARYQAGRPIIVTTNLTPGEMLDEGNRSRLRIFDRLLEKGKLVELNGASRRRCDVPR